MSTVVPIIEIKDKLCQKCVIPTTLIKDCNFKIGQFVILETNFRKLICKINFTSLPTKEVFVDSIISLPLSDEKNSKIQETLIFPDNIYPSEIQALDSVMVKIVLKNKKNVVDSNISIYESIVKKLLHRFVLGKEFVVDCSGFTLADIFNIHCLIVTDTVPTNTVGKLNRYAHKHSNVKIVDITSDDQLHETKMFSKVKLGGFDEHLKLLYLNFQHAYKSHNRVLICGPSGCGKSSLIKKFCSEVECFLVHINGFIESDFSEEMCKLYSVQIRNYIKFFPHKMCILFIDHIDELVPNTLKQSYFSSLSKLSNLFEQLNIPQVMIVATALHRKNINMLVSSLFYREINIGIPTVSQRKEIFQVLTKAYCDEIDCKNLALMTPGFIGSDISLLIAEAVNSKNANSSKSKPLLTTEDIEKVLVNMSPSVLKSSLWNLKVKPIYWKDIGGMFKVKERLQKCIELPLRNPEIFKKVDLPCPHGILLFGPPGCCKTTLARGLATECNANFFAANPAQIYSPYVGESEKNIVALFYQARLCAPSIVFLDEIDSLVGKREFGSKTQGVGERVLSTLLNEMDGFGTTVEFQSNFNLQKVLTTGSYSSDDEENDLEFLENKVIVVAATNRPDLIDDALLRPGRFDTILYVPPPNQEERESILKTLTQNVPLRNVDLKKIAQQTEDFSGADIKRLCSQAAICTLRHDRAAQYITEDNFNEVLEKMQPSINKKQIRMYEDLSRKYGPIIK